MSTKRILQQVAARSRIKMNVVLFDALEYRAEDLEEQAKEYRRMSKALLAVDAKLRAKFDAHAEFGRMDSSSMEWSTDRPPEEIQSFLEKTYGLRFKLVAARNMTYAQGEIPGLSMRAGVYIRKAGGFTFIGIEDFGA